MDGRTPYPAFQQQSTVGTTSYVVSSSNVATSSETSELRKALEESVKRLGLFSIENERLLRENHELRSKSQSSSEVNSLRIELTNLRSVLTSKDSEIMSFRSQISSLNSQLSNERARADSARNFEGERLRFQSEINSLRAEIASLRSTNNQSSQEDLKNDLTLLAGENDRLNAEIQDLKRQLSLQLANNSQQITLQRTIEDLRIQLSQKDAMIASLNQRIAELMRQQQSGISVEAYQKLKQESDTLRIELSSAQQEISRLKSENSSISTMKIQISQLQSELDRLRADKSSEAQISALRAEIQRITEESLQSRNNFDQFAQEKLKEIDLLSQLVSRYELEISTAAQELQAKQNRITDLERQLAEAQQSLAKLGSQSQEVQKLHEQVSLLTQQLAETTRDLGQKIAALEAELETRNKDITGVRSSLTAADAELQRLKDLAKSLQEENARLLEELRIQKAAHEVVVAERDGLLAQIKALQGSSSSTSEEVSRLQTQIAQLRAELFGAQKEASDNKARADELQQSNNNCLLKIDQLEAELQRLGKDATGLAAQRSKTEEANNKLLADLTQAHAEIQKLTVSNKQALDQYEKTMTDLVLLQQELNSLRNQVGSANKDDGLATEHLRLQYEMKIKELSDEVNIRGKDRDSLLVRINELENENRRLAAEFGLFHEQIAERDEIIRRLRLNSAQSPEEAQEKIKMLIIENERMIALNGRLTDEINGMRAVQQQYQELQIDYGVLQVNSKKLESMLHERNLEIDDLLRTISKLTEELKLKVRIIDEKTFMLVDLEGELEKIRRDTSETTKFLRELNINKEIINRLEEDNDRLRLEITKLKEEFLFKNQTEETMATLRKALDDEKELNTTKEYKIKDLEDKLSFLNPTVTGVPLMSSSNQALKDEVYKLQNQNQEKDLLLYKMKEVAQEMQREIDRLPELQLACDNQISENKRLKGLLEQKDRILQDFSDKFDLLKESLTQVLILEEKIKYLEEEVLRLTKALGESEATAHRLQASVTELQRANQKIPDLNNEIRFLKDELERITRQSKEKDGLLATERDRYKQYMTDLQAQSNSYLTQVAELEKLLRETKIKESQISNDNHGLINTLQNKIRELVLALTHMKEDNDKLDSLLVDQRSKLAAAEKDLVMLIAVKKEKDTTQNELDRTKHDLKAMATVLSNAEEKITRLEGMQGKNRILENDNNQLREEIRGLENRVRDLIHQREKINNDVNMSIEKGRTNSYTLTTQVDELKAQVKQQTDLVVFKDREIALLKSEIEDLLAKLRKGDLSLHELKAQLETLDLEYKGGQTKLAQREEQLREALKVDW